MNTMLAFAMGDRFRGNELMVFDWDKAAKIIKENYLDEVVLAGLSGDMEYTSGIIFEDGHPVYDYYTYLSSTWATPVLAAKDREIPCYVMEHETEWDDSTKWPQSALDILGVKESQS